MAILIRDPETDRIVRQLAARTGETMTEAVKKSALARLKRISEQARRVDREALSQALAYFANLKPTDNTRTPDEILGYNDEGHFD